MSLPTYDEANDAIRALFWDAWRADAPEAAGTTDAPPVAWDGVTSAPGKVTHARYFVRHFDGKQGSLGSVGKRRFTRFGLVTVQVFVLNGANCKQVAGKLAVVARGAYEGVGTAQGIWFRRVAIKDIGPSDGLYQINVTADFQYDELV